MSSVTASDLRKFFSHHTKTNGIDADTLARVALVDPAGLQALGLAGPQAASLDRRVRVTDRLSSQGRIHKRSIKDLVRQLRLMTPLTGDLGESDLAVLERFADPNLVVKVGAKRLGALIAKEWRGHQGPSGRWSGSVLLSPPSSSMPLTPP